MQDTKFVNREPTFLVETANNEVKPFDWTRNFDLNLLITSFLAKGIHVLGVTFVFTSRQIQRH